ncbi:hypothetical protein F4678DRAFT_486884 [Xylaria arbuscula]|nr:hypothetical protein F4678DRAFT_486884 [Xylaria arbuscula]
MGNVCGRAINNIASLYEHQVTIFSRMDDTDWGRASAEAHPDSKSVFLQNEAKIARDVCLGKACRIARETSERLDYRFVKLGILAVCCPNQSRDSILSRLSPTYWSDDKLPPDVEPSDMEDKWKDFKRAMLAYRGFIRASEYARNHAHIVCTVMEHINNDVRASPPYDFDRVTKAFKLFTLLVKPDQPWRTAKKLHLQLELTDSFASVGRLSEISTLFQDVIHRSVSVFEKLEKEGLHLF